MVEMSSGVRCHIHSYKTHLRRQLDFWYKEQLISVNKLDKMQQAHYQGLVRVENEKRRIQRQSRINREKEVQRQLREQAMNEREEATKASMEMSKGIRRKTKKAMKAMKFIPMVSLTSKQAGPTEDQRLREETSEFDGYGVTNTGYQTNYQIQNQQTEKNTASTERIDIQESPVKRLMSPTYPESNDNHANSYQHHENISEIPQVKIIEEITGSVGAGGHLSSSNDPLSQEDGLECQIEKQILNSQSTEQRGGRHKMLRPIGTRKPIDFERHQIGSLYPQSKISEFDARVVTSVKKYHKTSDGSYQSIDVTVRPAVEEFKVPSRRPHYLLLKALRREKENSVYRDVKVKEFIGDSHKYVNTILPGIRQQPSPRTTPGFPHGPKGNLRDSGGAVPFPVPVDGHIGKPSDELRKCRYLRFSDNIDTRASGMRGEKITSWESSKRAPKLTHLQDYTGLVESRPIRSNVPGFVLNYD